MSKILFERNLLELIKRTATDLPSDVERALKEALTREKKNSHGAWCLQQMLETVKLSRRENLPLCQDSGTLVFQYRVPAGCDTNALAAATRNAVSRATRMGFLRQNTVDAVTGASYSTNIAPGAPQLIFIQGARKTIEARLMMKGGGSENVSTQYSLPDKRLGAGRDLDGVYKCVMDAVVQAQGRGCSPGIIGVGLGGDRVSGMAYAKKQFFRRLNDESPVHLLAQLEQRLKKEINQLGIGPMGLGGATTVLGVKAGALSRLPASYFVSVSYMCWSLRRRGMLLGTGGGRVRWLY